MSCYNLCSDPPAVRAAENPSKGLLGIADRLMGRDGEGSTHTASWRTASRWGLQCDSGLQRHCDNLERRGRAGGGRGPQDEGREYLRPFHTDARQR